MADDKFEESTALVVSDSSVPSGIAPWVASLGNAFKGLMSIPGVAINVGKAVSQLVLGASNLGISVIEIATAKTVQVRSRIEGFTALDATVFEQARQRVHAGANPLAERAQLQEYFRANREQANREAVLSEALEDAQRTPPPTDTPTEIDDDWLAHFSDVAAKISDQGLRSFLARMLSDEIKKPGSYSVDAVMRIATLPPRTAKLLKTFSDHCSYILDTPAQREEALPGVLVLDENAVATGLPSLGLSWVALCELSTSGLVNPHFSAGRELKDRAEGQSIYVEICGRAGRVVLTKELHRLVVPFVLATNSGAELLRAIAPPAGPPHDYLEKIREWFARHGMRLEFMAPTNA